MCISFPGRIIAVKDDNHIAVIEIGGSEREVALDLLDEPVTDGDYLLCHAGFAIHKIDAEEAKKSLELLQEIIDNEIY
ncbi:HypC/HybG/HupF family hydrogenase formation chaperone [bacterium]|nr:HypC/HybG/HupF family hydrogenase formation chaperone [bacterium]